MSACGLGFWLPIRRAKHSVWGAWFVGTVSPVVEEVRFWRWLSVLGVRFVTEGVVLVGGASVRMWGAGEW
ncbi:hypothetical protein [Bartonella sp. ML71XJBT]|uniref:hypothetical protein n=1 Tax=Bartonella sp. ML71XJBT TaxID=3019094 RepID=UPI00235E97D1|nr:hypothetical protein [Bartonella sp. ML71XJBT]